MKGEGNLTRGAFRIRVASDRSARERAYRLAYEMYRGSGLISSDRTGLVVSPDDATPAALTLLAETVGGGGSGNGFAGTGFGPWASVG